MRKYHKGYAFVPRNEWIAQKAMNKALTEDDDGLPFVDNSTEIDGLQVIESDKHSCESCEG